MKRGFFVLILLIIAGPATLLWGQDQFETFANDPYKVKKTVLPNGLTVYLSENHNTPSVFGAVVVKAGGKYDPADATGMGHYLEHMLFKGTRYLGTIDYEKEKVFLDSINQLYDTLAVRTDEDERNEIQNQINRNSLEAAKYAIPNELDNLLNSIGSTGVNAFTAEEMIVYHNTFPSRQMEKWLEIYSHRFINPVFRLFQSELETVYEEKNVNMDGFGYQLFRTYNKNFYRNHPYGTQDIIGETEHLKNPSLTKMYEYYNTYYVANNMALVLCGDFSAEEILPMITKKFGKWKQGNVPEYPSFPENQFDEREIVSVKMTPVKVGIIGYRAPEYGNEDEAAIDVCSWILSNYSETGILDKMVHDQKIMMAQSWYEKLNDHGRLSVLFIPKLIGQSLGEAEGEIRHELERLSKGEFEDWLLESAKMEIQKQFVSPMENNSGRALSIADAFIHRDGSWKDHVAYLKRVAALSKADITAAAQKYIDKYSLVVWSGMGFPPKEKLEKPPYDPPLPPTDTNSKFARKFEKIPEGKTEERFVDWEKDLTRLKMSDYSELYAVKNPENNIFNLRIEFGIGTLSDPLLGMTASFLELIGTKDKTNSDLRNAFAKFGCSYYFEAGKNTFTVVLEGFEEYLDSSLALIGGLMRYAKNDESQMKAVSQEELANRKFEKKDPYTVGSAFRDYAIFGTASEFITRPSASKIKSIKGKDLMHLYLDAIKHECNIFYSGNEDPKILVRKLNSTIFAESAPFLKENYIQRKYKEYDEPRVLFLNRKDAVQSQVYFYVECGDFKVSEIPVMDAFNEYFGGGMSSLVFQEIREFRSLAYSAYATMTRPAKPEAKIIFTGYVGCQGDKTLDAVSVMSDLIKNMPEKSERMETIKDALIETSMAGRPGFRWLGQTVANWESLGFTSDPSKEKIEKFKTLEFEDILKLYEERIASKNMCVVITGDKKRIDMRALQKFGKVTVIREKGIIH